MAARWRSMRGLLLLPVVFAIGLLVLDLMTNAVADVARDCFVEILVVDDVTEKPAAGANIMLSTLDDVPQKVDRNFFTGADGRLSFEHRLRIARYGGILRRQSEMSFDFCDVRVSMPGFESRTFKLHEVHVDPNYPPRGPVPSLEIRLSRLQHK